MKQTFKIFLTESTSNTAIIELDDNSLKEIAKNCKRFWIENDELYNQSKYLYRGQRNNYEGSTTFFNTVRQDRNPKDTSPFFHDALDNYLLKSTSFKYRSKALFCSNDQIEAENYGTVYTIFPIGPYSFCWSPVIEDVYSDLFMYDRIDQFIHALTERLTLITETKLTELLRQYKLLKPDEDLLEVQTKLRGAHTLASIVNVTDAPGTKALLTLYKKFLTNEIFPLLSYKTGTLKDALDDTAGEVMVKCNSYYRVETDSDDEDIIKEYLNEHV